MAISMVLTLSSNAEKTLEMIKKVGVLNDKDVSNKVKQANLALELLGKVINEKTLTDEQISNFLK